MNAERLQDIYRNIHIAERSDIESLRQLTVDYPFYHLPYVVLAKYYYDNSHYKFEDMLRQAAMRVKDRKQLYHYIHGYSQVTEADIDPDAFKYEVEQDITQHRPEENFMEPAIAELIAVPAPVEESTNHDIPDMHVPEVITNVHAFLEIEQPENPEPAHEEEPPETAGIQPVEKPVDSEPLAEAPVNPEPLQVTPVLEHKATLEAFLGEDQEVTESIDHKPEEFVFEGKHEDIDLDHLDTDRDLIGEEIAAEFSFSKSFVLPDKQAGSNEAESIIAVQETGEPEGTNVVSESDQPSDNNELSEETNDSNENKINETVQSAQDTPVDPDRATSRNWRKNPVYSIESFALETSDAEEELSPEKDFFAWLQHPKYVKLAEEKEPIKMEEPETVETDDKKIDLIDRFININPQISRPKKEFFNPENMAKKSEVVDLDYVTETLANIYLEQGNSDLAIRAYEKLSLQNPSKQAYFASLIEKIKKEK